MPKSARGCRVPEVLGLEVVLVAVDELLEERVVAVALELVVVVVVDVVDVVDVVVEVLSEAGSVLLVVGRGIGVGTASLASRFLVRNPKPIATPTTKTRAIATTAMASCKDVGVFFLPDIVSILANFSPPR